MDTKRIRLALIAAALLALAFAVFVWPTRYTYQSLPMYHTIARIDRFTGEAEWLSPGLGWTPMGGQPEGASGDDARGVLSAEARGVLSIVALTAVGLSAAGVALWAYLQETSDGK